MTKSNAALPAKDAYRLWAATYEDETVLSSFDELAVKLLSPERFASLLDAGCGTGRRLPATPRAVGVDLVYEMLAMGKTAGRARGNMATADLVTLPFGPGAFDLAWCRLAAGHFSSLRPLYAELARVVLEPGTLLVTDLHPEAARRGHVRTFQDGAGDWHRVEHTIHDVRDHESEAQAAGLTFEARLELSVGPDTAPLFEAKGEGARAKELRGLPVLLAYRFSKRPAP